MKGEGCGDVRTSDADPLFLVDPLRLLEAFWLFQLLRKFIFTLCVPSFCSQKLQETVKGSVTALKYLVRDGYLLSSLLPSMPPDYRGPGMLQR